MSETNKTVDHFTEIKDVYVIGTDIVGFSKLDTEPKQKSAFENFTKLVPECFEAALKDCEADKKVLLRYLPTGDGCFIVLEGGALLVALALARRLSVASLTAKLSVQERDGSSQVLHLRIGLYRGNVLKVDEDLNGQQNYVGYGINLAQRVMDLAHPSQILVGGEVGNDLKRGEAPDTVTFFDQFPDKHGDFHLVHGVKGDLDGTPYGCDESPKAKLAVEVSPDSWKLLKEGLQEAMESADARWTTALLRMQTSTGPNGKHLAEGFCSQEVEIILDRLKGHADCIVVPDYSGAVAHILDLVENSPQFQGKAVFRGVATMPARLWVEDGEDSLARILSTQKILADAGRLDVERLHVVREEFKDKHFLGKFVAKHKRFGEDSIRTTRVEKGKVGDWEDFVLLTVPFRGGALLELAITSAFYRRLWSVRSYSGYREFKAVYTAMKPYEVAEIWFDPKKVADYKEVWRTKWESAPASGKAS